MPILNYHHTRCLFATFFPFKPPTIVCFYIMVSAQAKHVLQLRFCEEMRDYLVNIGMSSAKKIIIVASPNVQQNFKLQLFDSRKLKLIDGVWNIRSCTGNKYLKEINPMNMKGMDEEKVVKEIKRLLKTLICFLAMTSLLLSFKKHRQLTRVSKIKFRDINL